MTSDPRARRAPVYVRQVDGFGTVHLAPVDPDRDSALIHAWVTQERAVFWGMGGADRARVHEIYSSLDALSTHHAYLAYRDDAPAALFQTYLPQADPIGECYAARPGDVGVHLLIGPAAGEREPGFTAALLSVFLAFVLSDPDCRRIVVEPDARNARAVDRLVRTGFTLGPQAEVPGKCAQFAFLEAPDRAPR